MGYCSNIDIVTINAIVGKKNHYSRNVNHFDIIFDRSNIGL